MISRYALYDIAELSKRFEIIDGLPKGVKPRYNISPVSTAPIIINEGAARTIKLAKWGLVAQGAKDTNSVFRYKTYNVSSEKVFSRHSSDRLVRESRCLIPANGFFELNGSGKKRAYYVQLPDSPLISFAGVYSSWQDPDGAIHDTYSLITTEATEDMPDSSLRMPIIIKREDEARWLDSSINDANSLYDMLRPYPAGLLSVHEVSPEVHSPKPDHATLIDPIVQS